LDFHGMAAQDRHSILPTASCILVLPRLTILLYVYREHATAKVHRLVGALPTSMTPDNECDMPEV
jgi:hypothetical protein